MGNRWEIELTKTARMDSEERKRHANERRHPPTRLTTATSTMEKRDAQPGRRDEQTDGKPIRDDGRRKARREVMTQGNEDEHDTPQR